MKKLWICLAVSLLFHAIFFPGFLQAMMHSGAAYRAGKTPDRVNIRLVPPKPKVAIAKPTPKPVEKPKPKPAERPKPKPVVKETPRPVAKPAPKPREVKPVAQAPPKVSPRPAPPKAAPRPSAEPRRGGGRPPRSTRRLTSTSPPRGSTRPSIPSAPRGESGGQAGVVPPTPGEPDRPIGEGEGDGGGPAVPSDPVAAGPPASDPVEPPPSPRSESEASPSPSPPREPKPDPQPERTPRSASHTPKLREAAIEVPTLKLPANLRREQLKTSLQVRAVIEADGNVDFKLSESSGNPEVDDYVLEQLRKVAIVTTALDDQGNPKRVMKRVRVDIEVD